MLLFKRVSTNILFPLTTLVLPSSPSIPPPRIRTQVFLILTSAFPAFPQHPHPQSHISNRQIPFFRQLPFRVITVIIIFPDIFFQIRNKYWNRSTPSYTDWYRNASPPRPTYAVLCASWSTWSKSQSWVRREWTRRLGIVCLISGSREVGDSFCM